MARPAPLLYDLADTARWAAAYRARESVRADALFRDPFAARLAGPRGERIAAQMPPGTRDAWGWVTRTCIFDRVISEQIAGGVDLVVNLAAGLDARPYRMQLPRSLHWVEVDVPELLACKEDILRGERTACRLERIALDLSSVHVRRELIDRLARKSKKILFISEGLLVFLRAPQVTELARDIAQSGADTLWAFDLVSPGLLRRFRKLWGRRLAEAGATYHFGPKEGPEFFHNCGWRTLDVHSILKEASRFARLPPWLDLIARLPESTAVRGWWPWSGVCLMKSTDAPAAQAIGTLQPVRAAA